MRTCESDDFNFDNDGAERHRGAVATELPQLRAALAHLPPERAGVRLRDIAAVTPFLTPDGAIGSIAAAVLGPRSRAVRAILFDKTAQTNWSLGWHQDRTICVRQRIDIAGYGPWTSKREMQHVAPPFDILARMVTLRVHLDDVPDDNAPLLIAPGSHAQGRVPVEAVGEVVRRQGVRTCLADAGSWLYATPILDASRAAARPARRRVLQLDYATDEFPGGLEWLGI